MLDAEQIRFLFSEFSDFNCFHFMAIVANSKLISFVIMKELELNAEKFSLNNVFFGIWKPISNKELFPFRNNSSKN